MKPETKVAIYLRISDPQKQNSEQQLRDLNEFCQRRDWRVVQTYTDEMSGGRADRPLFNTMLYDAEHRKFNLLLFWSLDRFTREGVLKTLNYLEQLRGLGVDYCSYTEQYLDSTGIFKDVIISLLATLAQQERIRQSERAKAKIRLLQEKGVKLGRPVISTSAKEVRKMVVGRWSVSEVARALNVSRPTAHRRMRDARSQMESESESKPPVSL